MGNLASKDMATLLTLKLLKFMASGGGEGGFGIRIVEDGRYGFAHLVDPSSASHAIGQAISIARKSPSIEGFELPGNNSANSVGGMKDKAILDMGPEDLLAQGDQVLIGSQNLIPGPP